MKRLIALFLSLLMLLPLLGIQKAQAEESGELPMAKNIMDAAHITASSGFNATAYLYDGHEDWGAPSKGNCHFTLENETGIGSLYFVFYQNQEFYTVTDNTTGTVYTREAPFLHDFLNLEEAFGTIPTSVTVTFAPTGVVINEIYAFTPGQVPDFVQQWKVPNEGDTDLLLFSAHGDDEHLFFAGILPYYAAELNYQVQVVYLTNHYNNAQPTRLREMLDGLWAVGVDTYPVFGTYADFLQKEIETAYLQYKSYGVTRDNLIGFVMENLRRFKPKVVVTHDFNGEYGHGQHMVLADIVTAAVEISMDPAQYPESAEMYGAWDVPKTYIHLYEENPIVMDWDQPLDSFDGQTAFQASVYIGFQKHKSQVKDFGWFYRDCTKATEVEKYSPIYYGLYRSTVGADEKKNDFFENLTTYQQDAGLSEAEKLAEEEAQRQAEEEARLKAEEEARQASEEAAQQEATVQETTSQEATVPQTSGPSEAPSDITEILLTRFWYVPVILAIGLIADVILLCIGFVKKYF